MAEVNKPLKISERLALTTYNTDKLSHIEVDNEKCATCLSKACLYVCPAKVYELKDGKIIFHYEACFETGACIVACHQMGNKGIKWKYPKGGYGVIFRLG
jgi:ferredoxin like protein